MYEYVGDTENISQRQLEFVSEVLEKHGYTGKQVSITSMGKVGDNYGSYVKRITVEFDNGETFKMVAKIAPSTQFLGDESPASDVFTNETLLYTEILPKFVQLQKSEGVPEKDLFKYPICYGSLAEKKNEIILLEDLSANGYVMLNKMKPLPDPVVKVVLQNMANFHSMSYILKNKEPQTFERYTGALVNVFLNPELLAKTNMFLEIALNDMKSLFDNDRYTKVISETIQNFIQSGRKIITADVGSKYSIILHGDLWTNNVMFQMEGNDPVESILIDYQLSRETLPAADIHNFIFNCTDYETRSKHYYEWMDYYHSELERYLNNFGIKVNYVYPRDKFDADLKRYGKPCLGVSLMMVNFLLRDSQEAPGMSTFEDMDVAKMADDIGVKKLMEQTAHAIKKRVEGLVESCYEYGYLPESPKASFK